MTIMEQYQEQVKELDQQLEAGKLPLTKMPILQELKYRISVMESLRAFSKLSPITLDKQKIGFHYNITKTYLTLLVGEHPLGPTVDEEGEQRRETAEDSLLRVVEDGARKFKKFSFENEDEYRNRIVKHITAVLPIWIQYRNTYIKL